MPIILCHTNLILNFFIINVHIIKQVIKLIIKNIVQIIIINFVIIIVVVLLLLLLLLGKWGLRNGRQRVANVLSDSYDPWPQELTWIGSTGFATVLNGVLVVFS